MRLFRRILAFGSLGVFLYAAFNNFAPVDQLALKAKADFKDVTGADLPGAETGPKKKYIRIGNKDYEENARGVYNIDGVATFAKKGKAPEPPKPKNPNLGPPIDPSVLKDAMGLDENDEFFNKPAAR